MPINCLKRVKMFLKLYGDYKILIWSFDGKKHATTVIFFSITPKKQNQFY